MKITTVGGLAILVLVGAYFVVSNVSEAPPQSLNNKSMNAPSPADIKANRSDDPYIHCLAGEVRTRIEDGEDDESIPDSAIGACRTTLEEMAETLMPNPDLEGRVSTQDNYELQNRFDSDREKLMDERERMSLGQLQTMVAEYRRRGGR